MLPGLALALTLALGAVLLASVDVVASSPYSSAAETNLRALDLDLMSAAAAGYTESDLAPVLDGEQLLLRQPPPAWPLARFAYYRNREQGAAQLRDSLQVLLVQRFDLLRRAVTMRLGEVRLSLTQDERYGVDSIELRPIREQVDALATSINRAHSPADYRRAYADLGPPTDQLEQLRTQHAAEVAAVQSEADALKARVKGDFQQLRDVAAKALFDGRNDAAYAAFMRYGTLGRPYDLLESNLAKVQGGDLDQVALATALEERYRDEVHQALLGHLPQKAILVSLTAQELWAYEGGRLVIDTLVTTGRPALPTDVGLMRVNRKESPVHFISPFPHGSPYDYGSINARYALWFHPSGEAIHDSWWRSWYGPGSNVGSYGSHGCIGLPYGPIDVLFSWTPVGTPVVVIPGDGSPPADQVAQQSYNDPYFGYGSPSRDS